MRSEIRFDPLRGHRVVLSADRAGRPNEFRVFDPRPSGLSRCPFCVGNEDETPPEIYAVRESGREPDVPGWKLRVFPNRFPAVRVGERGEAGGGPFAFAPGVGRHEVVVDVDRHDAGLADFDDDELLRLLQAYRHRVDVLGRTFPYVVVFKNDGPRSGASLSHPHSQIVGLPELPATLTVELDATLAHRVNTGRCIACDLVAAEVEDERRVLDEADGFVTFLPYAGRFPAEMMIAPRAHPRPFAEQSDHELTALGRLLRGALAALRDAYDRPSFNLVFHGAVDGGLAGGHHWRFEIFPRLAQVGGFELGTGTFINGVRPEDAAAALRSARRR